MSYPLKYSKLDYSLIRWVNDLSDFEEINNPQNNQFFGVSKYDTDKRNHYSDFAYPLLNKDGYHWNGIHRLAIVEQNNDNIYTEDMYVCYVSGSNYINLPSVVKSDVGNIFYITMLADGLSGCGRLELRSDSYQEILLNPSFDFGLTDWGVEYGVFIPVSGNLRINMQGKIFQETNIYSGKSYMFNFSFDVNGTPQRIRVNVENTTTNSEVIVLDSFQVQVGDPTYNGSIVFNANENFDRVTMVVENISNNTVIYEFSVKEMIISTHKYSDKIKFVSNVPYVSVHTKNQYNRDGFNWESSPENNWIVTNLPAQCIGLTEIVPEREIEYINQASPSLTQTKNDKQISIEFKTNGKASILDSIESLSGNLGNGSGFYLNRAQVVPNADMERDEENINATATYLYKYNEDYTVIEVDDESIFSDLKPVITILNPLNNSVFTENVDNTFVLEVDYNIDIQLATDLTKEIRIYKDEILIETLTINDVVGVIGNKLQIKSSETYVIGEYRVEIDNDFVLDDVFKQFGAEGLNDWNFSVREARIYNDNYSDVYS